MEEVQPPPCPISCKVTDSSEGRHLGAGQVTQISWNILSPPSPPSPSLPPLLQQRTSSLSGWWSTAPVWRPHCCAVQLCSVQFTSLLYRCAAMLYCTAQCGAGMEASWGGWVLAFGQLLYSCGHWAATVLQWTFGSYFTLVNFWQLLYSSGFLPAAVHSVPQWPLGSGCTLLGLGNQLYSSGLWVVSVFQQPFGIGCTLDFFRPAYCQFGLFTDILYLTIFINCGLN